MGKLNGKLNDNTYIFEATSFELVVKLKKLLISPPDIIVHIQLNIRIVDLLQANEHPIKVTHHSS
jgi:hypothetical protein